MIASGFIFLLFSAFSIAAGVFVLRHKEPSETCALIWLVILAVFTVMVFAIHLNRLVAAGMSRAVWNVTGPDTLVEKQWHALLFSRIVLWATLFSFGLVTLAAANLIATSGALLVVASFGMPVAVTWAASMLEFDAERVKLL